MGIYRSNDGTFIGSRIEREKIQSTCKHEWKLVKVGMLVDTYICKKCGKRKHY